MAQETQRRDDDQNSRVIASADQQRHNGTKSRQSTRHLMLSKPKLYHYKQTKWVNGKGAVAHWGTQEMLTPPSEAALKATSTPRLDELSRAKSDKQANIYRSQYYYSCGRASQINLVEERAKTAGDCSARIEQLAQPKDAPKAYKERPDKEQYMYSCGRQSPVWPVDERAKTADPDGRPRITTLAKHKKYHNEYKPERPLPSDVAPAAKKLSACSERVESLAKAKTATNNLFRDPLWEVSGSARKATASPRTLELSRYKPTYEGYHYNYDYGAGSEKLPKMIRVVSRNARNAVASSRIKELSVPIVRQSMDLVQFDPHAFIIKPNVLNAYCPPRIAELAQPQVR